MSVRHFNEPRDIGYSKKLADLFSWTAKESTTIFAGAKQKDLFLFAVALAKHREQKFDGNLKEKQSNIPVQALTEKQKWAILSIALAEQHDMTSLKDESPIYRDAEKYAEEGLQILKSHIEKRGPNYPQALEIELKEILGVI